MKSLGVLYLASGCSQASAHVDERAVHGRQVAAEFRERLREALDRRGRRIVRDEVPCELGGDVARRGGMLRQIVQHQHALLVAPVRVLASRARSAVPGSWLSGRNTKRPGGPLANSPLPPPTDQPVMTVAKEVTSAWV